MKKKIIGFFLMILICGFQVFAQEHKTLELPMVNNDVEVSVGNVELEFCNEDNRAKHNRNLMLTMKPGEKIEICMKLRNNTNNDLILDLAFVDGTYTNDQSPRKACKNKEDTERFGKFVKDGKEKVLVKANSLLTLKKEMSLSEQHIGINNGCVVYSIADTKPMTAGGMSYNVIIRKAGFIDIEVEGEITSNIHFITQGGGNNLTQSELIIKEYDTYVDVYTSITNDGNIPMIVSGSGTLTDVLGKRLILGSGELRLLPGETRELHFLVDKERRRYFNLLGMKPSVSWYRTLYYGNMYLTYEPDITNSNIDKSLHSNSKTLEGSAFLIPRWLVTLVSLVIILILSRYLKRRNKKHDHLDTHTDKIDEKNNPTQHNTGY